MTIKTTLCSIIGAIGAFISGLFGGWNAALTTLVIFMGIDYITGIIVAGVFHKSQKSQNGGLQSIIGWKGLCRKGVTLAIVLVAYRLDLLIGTNYVRDAVTIAFCANEIISITENAALMGVPLPEPIVQAIEVLTSKK